MFLKKGGCRLHFSKPEIKHCVRLENVSWSPSAAIITENTSLRSRHLSSKHHFVSPKCLTATVQLEVLNTVVLTSSSPTTLFSTQYLTHCIACIVYCTPGCMTYPVCVSPSHTPVSKSLVRLYQSGPPTPSALNSVSYSVALLLLTCQSTNVVTLGTKCPYQEQLALVVFKSFPIS